MLRMPFLVPALLLVLIAADTASAGLFGWGQRRWQRRKAELRAELVWQLENKMDQDITREVEAITAQLSETAEKQVQEEAAKLQLQVQEALAQLRQEAASLVDAEAKRLDQEIANQLTDLKKQSSELVAAQGKQLKEQTGREIQALTAKFQEQSKALQNTLDTQIAKLPAQITEQVDKAMQAAAKPAEVGEGQPQGDDQAPAKDEVSSVPQPALPGKEVELVSDAEGP